MLGRRGLMFLSMAILLSCGGKSLDAVTGGGDSGAASGSAGGTSGGAGGTSGGAGGTSGTGGSTVADGGGDHGSGGADAGNDTVGVPDAALDLPRGTGNCPASVPTTGSFCSVSDLGTTCMFNTDAGGHSCTCSAGDLITLWKCTP